MLLSKLPDINWSVLLRQLRHAVHSAVSANGTTIVGLLLPILTALAYFGYAWKTEGWAGMKEQLVQGGLFAFIFMVLWWVGSVVWFFFRPEKVTFSPEEIAAFAQGITLAVVDSPESRKPIGAGFWANENGHMLTIRALHPTYIGMMMTPHLEGSIIMVSVGIMYSPCEVIYDDRETGVAIVNVANSPFVRKFRMVAMAENTLTKQKESIRERFSVAQLSQRKTNAGATIFLSAIEVGPGGVSEKVMAKGTVTKKSVDYKSKRPLRIFTSIPFKTTDLGSPVLDDAREVIGMVSEERDSMCVLVPSQYLVEAISESDRLMYCAKRPS